MFRRDDQAFEIGGGGAAAWRAGAFGQFEARRPGFRLAVDLGDRIGSPEWFRGLATLGAMIAAVVRLAPGIEPLPGRPAPPPSPAAEGELRAIGIAPAASGSGSGRAIASTERALPLASAPERPRLDLVATLRGGDGLAGLLARQGAVADEARQTAALIRAAAPALPEGTVVAITLGHRLPGNMPRPIEQVALRADLGLSLAVERVDGRLVLRRSAIAVDTTPLRITGEVGTSLYRAARTAGVPLTVLAQYLRAIDGHVAIDEIQPGDRFDIVMGRRRAASGESETGELLYAGMAHAGKSLSLLRWTIAGREQWFDGESTPPRREGLSLPVTGRLTSGFGMRFHPILGYGRMHQGIDLAAPAGTPIVAASDGLVRFAGWHGGHGNYVQLQHGGGLTSGYGHMSRFVVAPGERVRQGQLIGYVGSTGLSTGPHCHFEVFRNGVAIDPTGAGYTTAPTISVADRVRYRGGTGALYGSSGRIVGVSSSRTARGRRGSSPLPTPAADHARDHLLFAADGLPQHREQRVARRRALVLFQRV